MTSKIETTRREMYDLLDLIKKQTAHPASMRIFESALEDHLEQLRQGVGAAGERIEIQKVLIQQQRIAIGQMYMNKRVMSGQILKLAADNELLRKAARIAGEELRSTSTPCANTLTILGAVIDCQQIVNDWAIYGYKAKGQMKKLADTLNDSPELKAAMKSFEKAPSCAHSFHPAFPGGERCVYCLQELVR